MHGHARTQFVSYTVMFFFSKILIISVKNYFVLSHGSKMNSSYTVCSASAFLWYALPFTAFLARQDILKPTERSTAAMASCATFQANFLFPPFVMNTNFHIMPYTLN